MTRHLVVALTGEKGSGKGVLARHLAQQHGFVIDSFAAPLKRMTTKLTGWTAEQLADPVFKETVDPRFGFSPRWFMQVLGTECVRDELGADTWSRALVERVLRRVEAANLNSYREEFARIVVDDLRFRNEAESLQKLHVADVEVRLARVCRPGRPETRDGHASEQEVYQIGVDVDVFAGWTADPTDGERDLVLALERWLGIL